MTRSNTDLLKVTHQDISNSLTIRMTMENAEICSFRKAKNKLAVYTLSASGVMCHVLAEPGGGNEVFQGMVLSPRSIQSQHQYEAQISEFDLGQVIISQQNENILNEIER